MKEIFMDKKKPNLIADIVRVIITGGFILLYLINPNQDLGKWGGIVLVIMIILFPIFLILFFIDLFKVLKQKEK